MSNIKNITSKSSITTADFAGAAVFYVIIALEVLIGDLPSKGSHYSATFYDDNVGFFWAMVAIPAALGFRWLASGIRDRWRQRRNAYTSAEKGKLSIDGIINIGAAIGLMLIGICFLIFPIIEVEKGQIYGGQIFKNHLLTAEPTVFWQLLIFHLSVSLVPIIGGLLLIIFPPKRIQSIEARLNYIEKF